MVSITTRMFYRNSRMLYRSIRILYINSRMLYRYTRMLYINILMNYINLFHTFTRKKVHYAYTNAIITCNGKHLLQVLLKFYNYAET